LIQVKAPATKCGINSRAMMAESYEANDLLRLVPLGVERLKEAYPLVRDMAPQISQEQWHDFVAPAIEGDKNAGVFAIESAHGFIRGLCVFRVVREMDGSKNFVIVELVVSRTLYRKAAAKILIAAMEAEAKNRGCGAIVTDCPVESRWLFDLSAQEGYRLMRWRMSKKLGSAPDT
jgi:ribosomal protein S18 acetylase RimI-like enzyme